MTCPSCGGELVPGADRCPVCDASVAPRVEGALAADPRLLTPPARGKLRTEPPAAASEPIREIPGLRRRDARERSERGERSWRDEVQERIRSRRQKRTEAGLPLFEQEAVRPRDADRVEPAFAAAAPASPEPSRAQRVIPAGAMGVPGPEGDLTDHALFPPALTEAELADLPLRSAPAERAVEGPAVPASPRRPARPSLDDEVLVEESELEPGIEIEPPALEPSPLERPARALERAQAAAFDLALFAVIAAVVVYFAERAARVDLPGLAASWPWFLAFVGLLAGFYASYFTGTTGQTPGKLLTGLRVVDAGGRPPGYPRALARALVGLLGVTLAGAGLAPIAFDPAGRALHDRLFRTRVVRR
jgi:uncharacterized RDD family membrane protein YckC